MAVSLRLPDELSRRLNSLAAKTGRSKTFYMLEAIKKHLGELEGIYLSEQQRVEAHAGGLVSHSTDDLDRRSDLDCT